MEKRLVLWISPLRDSWFIPAVKMILIMPTGFILRRGMAGRFTSILSRERLRTMPGIDIIMPA